MTTSSRSHSYISFRSHSDHFETRRTQTTASRCDDAAEQRGACDCAAVWDACGQASTWPALRGPRCVARVAWPALHGTDGVRPVGGSLLACGLSACGMSECSLPACGQLAGRLSACRRAACWPAACRPAGVQPVGLRPVGLSACGLLLFSLLDRFVRFCHRLLLLPTWLLRARNRLLLLLIRLVTARPSDAAAFSPFCDGRCIPSLVRSSAAWPSLPPPRCCHQAVRRAHTPQLPTSSWRPAGLLCLQTPRHAHSVAQLSVAWPSLPRPPHFRQAWRRAHTPLLPTSPWRPAGLLCWQTPRRAHSVAQTSAAWPSLPTPPHFHQTSRRARPSRLPTSSTTLDRKKAERPYLPPPH